MKLIINADDFGYTKPITDGIVTGINAGAITSTSIMANLPGASYAIQQALENKITCVGLHINITKGQPLTKTVLSLCDAEGNFLNKELQYWNLALNPEELRQEIIAQKNFVETRRLKIDHLDTHHNPNQNPLVAQVITQLAREFELPLRRLNFINLEGLTTPDVWSEDFYASGSSRNLTVADVEKIIAPYKNTDQSIEIMCHPGFLDEHSTATIDRVHELEILLECQKNDVFDDVDLISFGQLR